MSRRMGANKMLLPFGGGTVLGAVIEKLTASGVAAPILVVTGHAAEEIENVAKNYPGVQCVFNAQYESGGMLSSVQAGVRGLPLDCKAFFIALGDQPMIAVDTVRELNARWSRSDDMIAVPVCSGKRGHPVLLSGDLRQEILQLEEPDTLKTIMVCHAGRIHGVEVNDQATLLDLDTPEDYELALGEDVKVNV